MTNDSITNKEYKQFIDWLWLIPAIVIVFGGFFSYANVDTTRDYLMAYRIVTGQHFPLTGQQLAFSFSTAPWWFYLLSVVLFIKKSWLITSIFTSILSASKFYFAYQIGRLVAGRTLGLLMVLCLTMVSLGLMQTITFTHTNLVEPIILLIVYLTLKGKNESGLVWLMYGVLCGMAFHAHPTAMLVGYFVFIRWLSLGQKLRNAAIFMVGLFLVFVPLIIHDLFAEKNTLEGVAKYLQHQSHSVSLSDYLKLIFGLWVVAPYAMLKTLMSKEFALLLTTVQVILLFIANISPVIYWRKMNQMTRKLLIHLWVFFLLSCLGLILIRTNTPWYLTYGVGLTTSLIIAIGLYTLYGQFNKMGRYFGLWIFVVFIITQFLLIKNMIENKVVVPSGFLADIKSLETKLSGFSYEIMAHQATAHGKFTCENQPVSLNGPYSNLIYSHSGMEHLSECGLGLFYGPAAVGVALVGVPVQYKQYINLVPIKVIGNTSFYHPTDISKQQNGWAEDYQHDYERAVTYQPNWQEEVKETQLKGGKHLTITNLIGYKMPLKVLSVKVNGTELKPVAEHVYSSLYVCDDCDADNTVWHVNYQEGVSGMTNVVSF